MLAGRFLNLHPSGPKRSVGEGRCDGESSKCYVQPVNASFLILVIYHGLHEMGRRLIHILILLLLFP
jgi:hypothetical protein